MVDSIQATYNAFPNSINKTSASPNVNGTTFGEQLSQSLKASDLQNEKDNTQGKCCGGDANGNNDPTVVKPTV